MFKQIGNLTFSLLWFIPCLYLSGISYFFEAPGPQYNGGIYYVVFIFLWVVFSFLGFRKSEITGRIPVWLLMISSLLLSLYQPLFENDHYRYLWEGKAIFNGLNPYLYSPEHAFLEDLSFQYKERIGFPYLTTVYPPLALVWFGLGGILPFKIGMFLLSILNLGLLVFLFDKIRFKTKAWHLIALIPFVQKEFVQAIHIDLVAFVFLSTVFFNQRQVLKKSLLSYWFKIIGIWPGVLSFLFEKYSIKDRIIFSLGFLLLPLALFFLSDGALMGFKAFSKEWIWNPGFLGILLKVNIFNENTSRLISIACFFLWAIFCVGVYFRNRNMVLNCFLIYSGLIFFSPVYNGWYSVWFMLPALLLRNNFGVLYSLSGVLGYFYYGHSQWMYLVEIGTHIFFPLALIELFLSGRTTGSTKHTKLGTEGMI